MADDEKTRLYKRLLMQTTDAVLLEQMRIHGFWGKDENLPTEPAEIVNEREHLEQERLLLLQQQSTIKNPEKALAEERQRRWTESKQRRATRKKEREQAAEARRKAYAARKQSTIVHAGAGVSAGLQDVASNVEELKARDLPILHNATDLAKALGIPLSSLRWLTYHRKGATLVHYHRYSIAKKTGGLRAISAPKKALAQAQRWVLIEILTRLEVEDCAHGFLPFRSIVTNAQAHVGKQVVLNLDLKEFFPSITFRRVKGLFKCFGYSEHVATLLALLVTEPPRVAVELGGKAYHVALGQRVLPQGACTSPAITNLLCRKLDRRLRGLAEKHGYVYTRYADDLTFSGDNGRAVGRLLRSVRSILTAEGFTEHPNKTKVMRRSRRQEVTGLTVNSRPAISREDYRELRAILHNVAVHGLESQNRHDHPNFVAYLRGRVEYACMVDPQRAPALRKALSRALHLLE